MTLTMQDAATAEAVLEPDLPIIDPHHHLWDGPQPRYLFDDLLADLDSGHAVEATVFVNCWAMLKADGPEEMRPIGEVEFANGIAAMSASGKYGPTKVCAGIVGDADLRLGAAVERVLERQERAGGGRFRGIRHILAHDPQVKLLSPPGVMATAGFREGFARLQALGYTFDAWMYHPQLPELVDLMEAFPEAKVVLNHVGGRINVGTYAQDQDAVRAAWLRDLTTLSRYPNLHVKLGGLGMPFYRLGFDRTTRDAPSAELAEAWRPLLEPCIELFGTRRCMFESNFPVDKDSCSYRNLWNAFKRIAGSSSATEKSDLFSETARRFYRL
ncbi:amidohydrolase family protein [Roseomonas elaeocarpi]|uniref:Amidohydrolase family protein n=1 Tax=Roseomonas elaeocarpi TaxID=907779 RepID=A0ABV6JMB3_9PROT